MKKRMAIMKISKATWDQVIAEENARRLAFGAALLTDHRSGKSLRQIALERNCSHETARKYIREAMTQEKAVAA